MCSSLTLSVCGRWRRTWRKRRSHSMRNKASYFSLVQSIEISNTLPLWACRLDRQLLVEACSLSHGSCFAKLFMQNWLDCLCLCCGASVVVFLFYLVSHFFSSPGGTLGWGRIFFFLSIGHKKKQHKKNTCNVKRCKVFTNRTDGGTDTCNPSRVIHCKRDSVFSSFSFFLLDASFPRGIPAVCSVSSRSPAYKQHESSWLLPVPLGQRLLITGAASSPQISACLL